MVDLSLIKSKICYAEKCLQRLKEKASISRESFLDDLDAQDIAKYNLQLAAQSLIDIAGHIVADEGWGVPATQSELADILREHDVVDTDISNKLKQMFGFRNLLIHEYGKINIDKVFKILTSGLGDIEKSLAMISAYLKL